MNMVKRRDLSEVLAADENRDLALIYACALRWVLQKPEYEKQSEILCEAILKDKDVFDANSAAIILQDISKPLYPGASGQFAALEKRRQYFVAELTIPLQGITEAKTKTRRVPKTARQHMALCLALEYCLGRMTYMPEVYQSYVLCNAEYIPNAVKAKMLQIIKDYKASGASLGMSIDATAWLRFEAELKAQLGS